MGELSDDLILDVYQCASEPQAWPEVMDRIRDYFRARGCILFEWDDPFGARVLRAPVITTNYKRDALDAYFREFHQYEEQDQDVYELQSLAADPIEIVSEKVLYEDEEEYLQRPHVRQLAQYGIRYRWGCMLDKDNPHRSRFSLQLGKTRGDLSSSEHGELSRLLPHIAKSLGIGRQFEAQKSHQHTLLTALDELDFGVCLLSGQGHVVATNKEFERQVEEYAAFRRGPGGRITFRSPAAQEKLVCMLGGCENHGKFGARPRKEAIAIGNEVMRPELCVELIPLHKSTDLGTSTFDGALMISRDTNKPLDANLELARHVYDFTQAESEVVELVAQGLRNSEIACLRDVSVQTVNSQVKSILLKSGSQNRTQLVRLLCSFL